MQRPKTVSQIKRNVLFNALALVGVGAFVGDLITQRPEPSKADSERLLLSVSGDMDRSMQKMAVVGASLQAFSLVAKRRPLTEGECALVLTDERKGQELFKWAITDLQQFRNIGASGYHSVYLARLNEAYRRHVGNYQETARPCYSPMQYAEPSPAPIK